MQPRCLIRLRQADSRMNTLASSSIAPHAHPYCGAQVLTSLSWWSSARISTCPRCLGAIRVPRCTEKLLMLRPFDQISSADVVGHCNKLIIKSYFCLFPLRSVKLLMFVA